jgi:FAR-17a/AIG1-like protein
MAAHAPAAVACLRSFLTFYSFTLQTLQLGLATADDVVRARSGQRTSVWTRYTDDLACAIFALTHVVSIMFYTVQVCAWWPHICCPLSPLPQPSLPPFPCPRQNFDRLRRLPVTPDAHLCPVAPQGTTKMMVEGGSVARPPWLDVSVHAFNTLVAWADLLYSEPRSFSAASERLSCVLVTVYLAYLMLCRSMNGRFPYPILNALPYPFGFLAFVAAGLLLFATSFRVGKLMNARLRHVNISIRITRTTPLARRRWGGSGRRSGGGSSSSGVQTDADGSSSGSEGGSGVLGSERGGSVTAHSLSIGVLLGKQRRRQRAAAKA